MRARVVHKSCLHRSATALREAGSQPRSVRARAGNFLNFENASCHETTTKFTVALCAYRTRMHCVRLVMARWYRHVPLRYCVTRDRVHARIWKNHHKVGVNPKIDALLKRAHQIAPPVRPGQRVWLQESATELSASAAAASTALRRPTTLCGGMLVHSHAALPCVAALTLTEIPSVGRCTRMQGCTACTFENLLLRTAAPDSSGASLCSRAACERFVSAQRRGAPP